MKKILAYDIETSALVGYAFSRYQTDLLDVKEDSYMICFSYQWLHEKKTHVVSIRTEKNEEAVVKKLWELFNEADVLLAHNGDKFDQRYTNGRFLKYGLPQPSPYDTIDTLKIARRKFKLNSNKLDHLGEYLGVGRKISTGGKQLWIDCMNGDVKALKKMEKYNIQDVKLLIDVYNKLVGWSNKDIYLNVERPTCASCGGDHLHRKGEAWKGASKQVRWLCQDCGQNLYTGIKEKLPLKIVK